MGAPTAKGYIRVVNRLKTVALIFSKLYFIIVVEVVNRLREVTIILKPNTCGIFSAIFFVPVEESL